MAKLSDQDRFDLWALYMQHQSGARAAMPLLKADYRAFFDAVDDWIDSKAAEFNAAIPQPARSSMTAAEKAFGFVLVLRRRFEVL